MEQKVFNFFRFEDLRVYHKALDFSNWTKEHLDKIESSTTNDFYKRNFYKATLSIVINISEGSSRGKSQFVQYLKSAKTSVRECVVYTSVGLQKKYFDNEVYEEARTYLIEISKMVGALISSLQKGRVRDDNEYAAEIVDGNADTDTLFEAENGIDF